MAKRKTTSPVSATAFKVNIMTVFDNVFKQLIFLLLSFSLVGKSPEDLIPLYWDEVTKRAQRDRRTLLAVYGSDRSGTLFKEGENPEYFTLNKLPNILERVVHYFESPIDGVTSPMLYFGTWLSTFVKHLEDKNLWSISYLHFGPPKVW